MNRLRDVVDREGRMRDDPLFRKGVELLRGTPPTAPSTEVELRVWHAIRRPATAPASRGLRGLGLKLAVAGAIALVAGTAGAMITHRWIAPRRARAGAPVAAPAAAPRRAIAPRPEEASAAEPAVPVGAPAEAPPAKIASRPAPKKAASAAPTPALASVARERTEVLDALIALRREHDAARAGTLLARYLAAHPHGALREEALVLAIEAADTRGDRAAGAERARAYLDEFPVGRFSPFARSHTGRDGAREKDPTH